jgi:hypothetical protein
MISRCRFSAFAFLVMALLSMAADRAQACSSCFGDPSSNIAKGALWGVIVLGGVTYCLLMFVVGTGIFWYRRSRRYAQLHPVPGDDS